MITVDVEQAKAVIADDNEKIRYIDYISKLSQALGLINYKVENDSAWHPSNLPAPRPMQKKQTGKEWHQEALERGYYTNAGTPHPMSKSLLGELGSDIFGALLQDSEGSMRIYIDKDQPASRYRFSAAHELGHYVDRSRRLEVLPRDIDRRSSKMPDFNIAEGKREIWAIEFAAELLMPRIEIQQQRKNGNTSPVHLTQRFNVPLPVMNHRIQELG